MTDIEDDIKATAEAVIGDAEELLEIEQRKLDLSPGTPELAALSGEAEATAEALLTKAKLERQLVAEAEKA